MRRFVFLVSALCLLGAVSCDKNGGNGSGSGTSGKDPVPGPVVQNYIENGKDFGPGIAILGDWDKNPSTPDTELYWAPVNCGYEEVGAVATDTDHRLGKLYQWGAGDSKLYKVEARALYYDAETPSPWYDDELAGSSSDKWLKGQGPCPDGWRLPTTNEFKVLVEGKNGEIGWVEDATYAGVGPYKGAEFFGANASKKAGTGVFFPAAGALSSLNGGHAGAVGMSVYYWTSTTHSVGTFAYALTVEKSGTYQELKPAGGYGRSFAFSVRCVRK